MAGAWEYEQAVNNVSSWYNTSADNVWNVINGYNLTPEQTQGLLPTVDSFLYGEGINSGYNAVKYADGSIASWNNYANLQTNTANAVEQAVNSNAGLITQQAYQLPATTNYSGTGGTLHTAKGVTGGTSGATKVMSQVSAGVAAAGLGIKLGKAIDSALYNLNPDFWDNNGMSTLNPQTWDSITVDMSDSGWEGTLKRAFNAIFDLDPQTQQSQMYIDADAAAYLAMYLNEQGVFAPAVDTTTIDNETRAQLPYPTIPASFTSGGANISARVSNSVMEVTSNAAASATFAYKRVDNKYGSYMGVLASKTPASYTYTTNGTTMTGNLTGSTVLGKPVYYAIVPNFQSVYNSIVSASPQANDYPYSGSMPLDYARSIAYCLLYGTTQHAGGVEGITDQSGATQPNFAGCETPLDYKQALQTQYPDMWNNAITQQVAQPDGTVVTRVYVPVGTPTTTGTQDTQPTTDPQQSGQSQSDTKVDPTTATQTLIETLVKYIENSRTPDTPDTPNPTDTGDGNTPPVVVPTGSASALWSVYNPTQAQLNSLGAWLWSSNFVDQLLKLFNDPMQAIIGVHKVFATPATSGAANIRVGYLDSGVSANVVSAQYTDINCGSVTVSEQFGNVFDYNDTHIRLYLPFIGIVDLDTADVMRGTVSVVYHVDVITGACLADVRITRDGAGGTLYQYAGDAAVRYPISSSSYMGVAAGIASAVGGIATAVMSGGATLPLAAGAIAGGIGSARTQVQHSGGFSGNAGAMGAKKPYIIIERPQTLIADGYTNYQGKGANTVRSVGQMSGYFKFSDVHTNSISGASESEIQAIKAALESGVIK